MKGLNIVFLIIIGLLLVSCTHINHHMAQTVEVKKGRLRDCTYVGEVSTQGSISKKASNKRAYREHTIIVLKRQAFSIGANTIVIKSAKRTRSSMPGTITADAYHCSD